MPMYNYRMAKDGAVVAGVLSAPDESALAGRIRAQGGVLISARARASRGRRRVRVARRDLITFTSHLHSSVSAGIPLLDSLRAFVQVLPEGGFSDVVGQIVTSLEAGKSLADALREHPRTFPSLYVHMVETGEESGRMESVLESLLGYLEWQDEIVKDLRQATVYPTVVLSLVFALITFLLTFVLPRFIGIFSSTEMVLPTPTIWLMAVGNVFSHYWYWGLALLGLAVAGLKWARRTPKGGVVIDHLLFRLPVFGTSILYIALSRLTYSLGLLLDAGIDISRSLTLTTGAVGNRYLARETTHIHDRVLAGHGLAESIGRSDIFPPLMLQMVTIGEQSGTLPQTLDRMTDYLKREVKASLKRAFSILEPAITVFLGVVVGGIALIIFYTLYRLIMAVGAGH
jgi:type IV pilus assembly protein PilC